MRITQTFHHAFAFGLVTIASWRAMADPPSRDVSARARAIGTDKPQDVPARLIVTSPAQARLKFPAFVIGIEKANREKIGCPPDRGLDTSRAPGVVREQIRRTFHETPFATDCLFVSHIAEFVPTPQSDGFAPVLRYDAYREADPPAPREVFESGRQATLALRDRIKAIAAARAKAGRQVSHLVVFATGWHTPQAKTLANMDELFAQISAAGAGDESFSPVFFGISWPSFSDEIAGNIGKGVDIFTKFARRQSKGSDPADRTQPNPEPAKKAGTFTDLMNDRQVADKLGFLGYPAISKDADEVGMVPVSTLVSQVLMPVREALPGKPRVIVIGHSFGARVASWTPFTAPLLPAVDGAAVSAGPDLVIGLQAALPFARFDTTVKHRRPYVEGSPFFDHAKFRTIFAYTCAEDEALRYARVFDIMIGDAETLELADANESAVFSKCKVVGDDVIGLARALTSRKVVLIDAREIIKRHDDVRNPKVGRLVWTLLKAEITPAR
jgi:hypothetical protein